MAGSPSMQCQARQGLVRIAGLRIYRVAKTNVLLSPFTQRS